MLVQVSRQVFAMVRGRSPLDERERGTSLRHRHSINVAGDTGSIPRVLGIDYLGPIYARIPDLWLARREIAEG